MNRLLVTKVVCLFVFIYYTLKMAQTLSALRSVAVNQGHATISSPAIFWYQTLLQAASMSGFITIQWLL